MTEQTVTIAAKLYDARRVMRQLLGDRYQGRVAEIRSVIEAVVAERQCEVLQATTLLAEKCPDPYLTLLILATAVEMIEGNAA